MEPSRQPSSQGYLDPLTQTRINELPRHVIDSSVATGKRGHTEHALALTFTTTTGVEPFQEAKSPRYPYPFSGKKTDELPQQAIDHLVLVTRSYGMLVPLASYAAAAEQHALTYKLFEELEVIDTIIVASRHDATNVPPKTDSRTRTNTWWPRALQRDDPYIRQIVERLLPERVRIVNKFVVLFDALVWIELKDNTLPTSATATLRDTLLNPVLDYADAALADVQRFVEREWKPRRRIYSDIWGYRAVTAIGKARQRYFATWAQRSSWPTTSGPSDWGTPAALP